MQNRKIKLADLVKLEGLEKPRAEVPTMELGGNSEKAKSLTHKMSDLAGTIDEQNAVMGDQVVGLVEGLKHALVHELPQEKAIKLLATLKSRFEKKDKPYQSTPGILWADIQKKLQASPEKLWSLNEMERTNGKPDVLGQDEKTAEYIFVDFSAESPEGRRNCVYDREAEEYLRKNHPTEKCRGNAVSMAALMGVEILTEQEYQELQTKGEFDKGVWTWLKTPVDKRKNGPAFYGIHHATGLYIDIIVAYHHSDTGGFRASLRV